MNTLHRFLDSSGRLTTLPARHADRLQALCHLARLFEPGRIYGEREVNARLDEAHAFHDFFLLRRELVEARLLCRTRSGSRYWRNDPLSSPTAPTTTPEDDMLFLPAEEATLEELEELKALHRSVGYIAAWTGVPLTDEALEKSLRREDLPPNGNPECFHFRRVVEKSTGRLIAMLDFYMGYPDPEVLWIGTLYVHRDAQNGGRGSRIVSRIAEAAAAAGFRRLGIGVHLKNWPALRFWTRNGFDRIHSIHGDREIGETRFSVLSLRRELHPADAAGKPEAAAE